MMVEALNDKKFLNILNESTFIVPDGMPLVWLLRKKIKILKEFLVMIFHGHLLSI